MLRTLLLGLAVLFGLLLVAVLALPVFVDKQMLARLAAEQIEAQTGAELQVGGDIELSLLPRLSLGLSEVTLVAPEQQLRLQAGELRTGVALLPLLRRVVEIDTLTLRDLELRTPVSEAEAATTMSTAGMSRSELDAFYAARAQLRKAAANNAAMLAAPLALDMGELRIENARLLSVDSRDQVVSELVVESFLASGVNTAGRPVPLQLALRIPGSESATDITVALDGEISTDLNAGTVRIVRLEARVNGATAVPLQARLSGEAELASQSADLALNLDLGDSRAEGQLRYAGFESPQINATLHMNTLNPALLVLAGPEAPSAAPTAPQDEGDEPGDQPLPWDLLRNIDTQASLRIDRVELDAHVLSDVQAQLRAVDGKVTLSEVRGQLHEGEIAFDAELNARYAPATLRTAGGLNGLQLGSAADAMDLDLQLSGAANLNWELQSAGSTANELIAALSGPISLRTADVGLRGISLEQNLCRAVALVNQESLSASFPSDTRFEALEADISLGDGLARLAPLSAKLPAVTLTGTGQVNLLEQDLRASFRAQLQAGLGELDPACRINERLAELRWPVECEGSLSADPASWCSLNSDQIVRDLLEGEARRKLEKEAGKLLKKFIQQ